MFKKFLLVTVSLAGIGVLIFGAVNRTLAINNSESAGSGGNGRGYSESITTDTTNERQYFNQKEAGVNEENGIAGTDKTTTRQYLNAKSSGVTGGSGNGTNAENERELYSPSFEGTLSVEEVAALQYMREEEKLARDVYTVLYEQWGQQTLLNISQSEQSHMDAVKELLDGYGIADPASSEAGVFTNPELQALYTELISTGTQSLNDALKVGAAIEEIDILDLEARLLVTSNMDVQRVFENLKKGSINHLNAFTSTFTRQTGEEYTPQYMSLDAYNAILSSRGGNNSKGNGYNGGNS